MQNTSPKGHRLKVCGVFRRGVALFRRLLLFSIFFLLSSTENFRVLVSRPGKQKGPHTRMFFGDWLHDDWTKQRFRSVASPIKGEARVLFDVDVCLTYTQHGRLHHLENHKTRPKSVHNRNSTLFLISQPCLSLQDASVSFWRANSRCARPQIHGNRGEWRNSLKPLPVVQLVRKSGSVGLLRPNGFSRIFLASWFRLWGSSIFQRLLDFEQWRARRFSEATSFSHNTSSQFSKTRRFGRFASAIFWICCRSKWQ